MHRKTSHRSQIIPKKILHNTTFLLQLQYIAGHSLYHIFHQCESSLFNWLHINKLLENFGNNFELLKWSHTYFLTTSRYYTRSGEVKLRYKDSHACLPRNMMGLIPSLTETEFKEFEPRLKGVESLCTNSDFLITIIFETKYCRPWIFQTMNSVKSNNLNLKYQRFTTSGS